MYWPTVARGETAQKSLSSSLAYRIATSALPCHRLNASLTPAAMPSRESRFPRVTSSAMRNC